jgi:hypothetical protein
MDPQLTKAISQDDLFTHLITPSDRLIGLFIMHIRPASALRLLNVNALKSFLNSVLFCTIEVQAMMWESENALQTSFGSIYKGLSFPVLDTLVNTLELRTLRPELSYLLFAELERALRNNPLQLECGIVMSDASDIHFFTRKIPNGNVATPSRNSMLVA